MSGISVEIYEAFRLLKAKDLAGAEAALQRGLAHCTSPAEEALVISSQGVLAKSKGDFREAWKCYEKAEKLLPDDPALKIILAKLLIERFAQYDTAIKKLKSVLKLAKGSPSFEHQAHAAMAVAYLRKGEKKKSIEMMERAIGENFDKIRSAKNINLEVVEAFLARNFEVERCRTYLTKALTLAQLRREDKSVAFLTKLLASLP